VRNFLSERVRQIPPSGIRRFFDIAATMPDVISLGIGEPDFVTPAHILEAGIRSLQRGETKYTSNSGTIELRQAVAQTLERRYGIRYDAEAEVLATVGVSEGLYLAATAFINPGDEVIVPQPCFVAYTAEVILAGGVPVPIATKVEDNFQVTAAQVEAVITPRTRALLIGYPNNPTGAVMSRDLLLGVCEVARRHDLLVISDELYDRLVYGVEHVCVPTLPGMWERTILLGGFSKNYAMTGWRIGYVAAPPDLLAAMRKIHQYTIMSAPTTAQAAALVALTSSDECVEEMRSEYDRRRRLLVDGLNRLGLPCFEPQGAFYTFPSVAQTGMTDEEFAEALLREEQVAVVPGNAFGAGGEGYVRACYATAYEKIEIALERIGSFMRRHG
jgi:aminotransferase